MHLINTSNIEKARKEINKILDDHKRGLAPQGDKLFIIVQAQNDEFNRKILEYGKFHVLLSPESGQRKIKLRQADSGLNNVLAKIAGKNNVAIGIDVEEISRLEKKQKAEQLAKIIRNIKICRKAKARLAVRTKDKRQAVSLLLSLGASSQQVAQATFI